MSKIYANTAEMAAMIGRSADWLKKRKANGTFTEGIHYFHPNGERDPFWKIEAIKEWIEQSHEPLVDEILQKMVS
ncbi:hypothetical protein [Nitratiruptor sp. SB155-2]|uniref:hypothetical protein n=1 Tax=Nitratiruptor sp. (strain SB155-2) TaxID=387092 RepID=UPI0002C3887E|nr:hypothetical protein [Nitratiruptor sp. SB155-2]BAN05311.1 hypothetical protein [Nitratiruptor phage NrS-1]